MNSLLILGAGGHGKVIAEAAEQEGRWSRISFLDDREDIDSIYNFRIVGKLEDYPNFFNEYKYAFVAIGNNEKRVELIDKLISFGYKVPVIVHPRAYISKYSILEDGTVVLPGAVVNTSSKLGRGCVININACVDHDCEIGEGVHISSGAVVRSMSQVGDFSLIGAGTCVRVGSILGEKFILTDGDSI